MWVLAQLLVALPRALLALTPPKPRDKTQLAACNTLEIPENCPEAAVYPSPAWNYVLRSARPFSIYFVGLTLPTPPPCAVSVKSSYHLSQP